VTAPDYSNLHKLMRQTIQEVSKRHLVQYATAIQRHGPEHGRKVMARLASIKKAKRDREFNEHMRQEKILALGKLTADEINTLTP
jgi:hypothetical protein